MIIVTGAGGFIGSALIWELNEKGFNNVLAVDHFGKQEKWKNVSKRKISDLCDVTELFDFLARSSEAQKVEAIFHLGAISSTTEVDMDLLIQNNIRISQKLWHWCAENNKRFIYASSCATYGAGELGFDDNVNSCLLRPLNKYGYSKVFFDRWIDQRSSANVKRPAQVVGLKFSNVYGPQEYHKADQASVVFKAYAQVVAQNKMQLFKSYKPEYKDGEQMRDFVYIKDVTAWMTELLSKPNVNSLFNMGFGKARTWYDLGNSIFKTLDKKTQIDFIEMPLELRDHYQYFTEAKMEKWLAQGFNPPKWSLEEGVRDYIKNYLSQHDRYL
jgi:ADP-L-glycero-D-manno-heptose 6-epimerase